MRPWSRGFKGAPGNFDSPGGLCHNPRERFPKEVKMHTTRKTILAGISLLFVGAAGAVAVLKVEPDYEDAHRLLARLYWHNLGETQQDKIAKDSLRKAIVHLEALTRINPSDTESWVGLARLYKLSNQHDKAEEALTKALAAEPNSRTALADLAQIYFDRGDYDQAVGLLKKIPDSDKDPQLLGMLAFGYTRARDYDNAIATYEKALALDSENQEIRRAYAEALMSGNKLDAARKQIEEILKADPDDGPTHLRLAQLDRQEGLYA